MELREIKQQFFALRNGLLADTLRKQASIPHKLIFGLNIIQLRELASTIGKDEVLATALWADFDCRESRLLAPMILPSPNPEWLQEIRTPEEADILCHSSLRHHPDAQAIALSAINSPDPLRRYSGLRLLLNLLPASAPAAKTALASLPSYPLTTAISAQLAQELEFLL